MSGWLKEFIVKNEENGYAVKVGSKIASSLAGFVAGAVFASIVWGLILYYLEVLYIP